jgi:hypothetical protein
VGRRLPTLPADFTLPTFSVILVGCFSAGIAERVEICMPEWEAWEWALCAGTVLVATTMLVRLMLARRDAILDEMSWQAEFEQRRKLLDANRDDADPPAENSNRLAG